MGNDCKRLRIAARLLVLACAGDHATVDAVLVTERTTDRRPNTERVKRFQMKAQRPAEGAFRCIPVGRAGPECRAPGRSR